MHNNKWQVILTSERYKTNSAAIISTLICLLCFFVIVIGRQRFVYSLREMNLQFALFVLRSKWNNLLLIEVKKLDPPLNTSVFRVPFFSLTQARQRIETDKN